MKDTLKKHAAGFLAGLALGAGGAQAIPQEPVHDAVWDAQSTTWGGEIFATSTEQ